MDLRMPYVHHRQPNKVWHRLSKDSAHAIIYVRRNCIDVCTEILLWQETQRLETNWNKASMENIQSISNRIGQSFQRRRNGIEGTTDAIHHKDGKKNSRWLCHGLLDHSSRKRIQSRIHNQLFLLSHTPGNPQTSIQTLRHANYHERLGQIHLTFR